MRVIRADSTEYLVVKIDASHDVTADPTALSVDNGATWYPAEHTAGGVRLLVGPYGAVSLVKGVTTVYVRIQDGAEIPIFPAGRLNVT